MHLLKDKVAVVIGASRGIGRGIAIGLGREGAQLVLAARTMEPGEKKELGSEGYNINGSLKETAREIEKMGGKADITQCDALDYDQVEAMVEETISKYSRIDILVISLLPDCQLEGTLGEMPVSAWDDHMSVVPRAYYYAGRAVAPQMAKQGSGLITAVSSSGGAVDFYSIPYGQAAVELYELYGAGQLPDVDTLVSGSGDAIFSDSFGHADDILIDLGRLVWLNAIYDVDLNTYAYDPGYIADLKGIAQTIMDAHDASYGEPAPVPAMSPRGAAVLATVLLAVAAWNIHRGARGPAQARTAL